MIRLVRAALCVLLFAIGSFPANAQAPKPIRVAIVGLVHGHVKGFLSALPKSDAATLVAVVEPDTALAQKYAAQYHMDSSLFYTDLETMLNKQKPDAVLVYTNIKDHRRVVEAAAKHGISSMVEKPLAISLEDALAIRKTANEHHVQVLTNYETSYYFNNNEVIRQAQAGKLGVVRKIMVYDGHEGPKEIGVGPEWLPWITDPALNGAGSLFDFGCYGADLSTVILGGKTPISVTAVAQTDKPDIYPRVDDDATIIVRYDGAQAVLMPSWTWSFARKDMEVDGTQGAIVTVTTKTMEARYKGDKAATETTAPALDADHSDSLHYMAAVLHGSIVPKGDLAAMDTNVIVMQILDAARESVRTGKTVMLKPLP